MSKDFFCSEISRNSGESMVGTASIFDQMLLIEYPKPWSEKPLKQNEMSAGLNEQIKALQSVMPNTRVVLIKKAEKTNEGISVFGVNNRENSPSITEARFGDHDEIIEFDLTSLFSDNFPVKHLSPLYLVCTNGKKDKCCSKWGIPLYNHLKTKIDDVWQCTHLGGDRFAPNLLYLPQGIYYGGISENEVDRIIESHLNGNIYIEKFRGRSCYFRVEQAAEYFLRKETGNFGMGNFQLNGSEKLEKAIWKVSFMEESNRVLHILLMSQQESEESHFLSCDSVEKKTTTAFELLKYSTSINP